MASDVNAVRGRDLLGHEVLVSGAASGLVAGAAMMLVAMLGAAIEGLPLTHPALVLGESFVGPDALDGTVRVAYGVFVHLGTSVALGIGFAALVPRDFPIGSAIGVGVGYTFLVFMFILMPLVVPWVSPGFREGMQGIGGTWIIGLGMFGTVLGAGPSLRRWASRRAGHRAEGGVRAQTDPAPPRTAARTS